MCGIFAVLSASEINTKAFRLSLDSMANRGPDYGGIEYTKCSNYNIALGHRRLSILDVSSGSNQPVMSDANALLYNGEIYNYLELSAKYHLKRTSSDTLVLFDILRSGINAVPQFNGMWSYAHLLKSELKIELSRDPHGKKPLFYYLNKKDKIFIISSTVKAILKYLKKKYYLNRKMCAEYLSHKELYESEFSNGLVEGVTQVKAGQNWLFDIRDFRFISKIDNFTITSHARAEYLEDEIDKAVCLRMRADRKVGLLLSGGIDSAIVLSSLKRQGLISDLKIFIGDTGISEDAQFALKTIRELDIDCNQVEKLDLRGRSSINDVENLAREYEKPFQLVGNSIGTSLLYKELRNRDYAVVLDGSGGDEVFGGYWDRYSYYLVRDAIRSGDWSYLIDLSRGNHLLCHLFIKGLLKNIDSGYRYKQNRQKLFMRFTKLRTEMDYIRPPTFKNLSSFQKWDIFNGRLPEWVFQIDRSSMQHGVEARSPLLDINLVKYIHIENAKKFKGRYNKKLLRDILVKNGLHSAPTRVNKQGFRWDQLEYLKRNASDIKEIMRESSVLNEIMEVTEYLDKMTGEKFMQRLSLRMFVLATTEKVMSEI